MRINPDTWASVEAWFHRLADLPEDEKSLALERIRTSEPGTYTIVKALLDEESNPHPLLDRSARTILDGWHDDASLAGSRIGAFTLTSHIADGAMGSVFLAERADGQFRQTVALKLMKSAVHNDTFQHQFNEERQILAGLNHPHIARLYDGGFTDKGRPYFTMEYISGLSLTEYCSKNKLSTRERIGLFQQTCEAVSYAHRALIAHLDLKPGNILVDANGKVKLLDFGISHLAKPSHEPSDNNSNFHTSNRFTLAYASPEQLTSQRASTSSDIYSLGTILYEILTGVHPFQQHFHNRFALKEAILTKSPKSIHDSLSLSDSLSVKDLTKDLQAICEKALQKDPGDRYSSVEELLADIGSCLYDYPVKAREQTAGYVFGKYLRRNRKLVSAAGISLVLLIVIVGYYTYRLSGERDVARQEAAKSAEVVNLLTGVFSSADPNNGNGDTLTAVQLLDEGLAKLGENLKSQPEVLASLMQQISSVYLSLGRYEKSDSLARRAMAVWQESYDAPHKAIAGNLVLLSQVFNAKGMTDSAQLVTIQAIAMYQRLKMTQGAQMADAWIELSAAYYNKGQFLESDSVFRKAYAIHQNIYETPHPDLANDLHVIGTSLRKLGEYEEAEKYLEDALAMKHSLYKEPHLEIAVTLNHLASLKQNQGQWRESVSLIKQSLDQRQRILGPLHVETLASQSNLARAYTNLGILDSAAFLYEDALAKVRSIFGDGHYYVAAIMQSLANTHLLRHDLSMAEELFREAIALNKRLLPEDNVNSAFALMGLGKTLMGKGNFQEARTNFEKAYILRHEFLPPDHELVGISQLALGECLLALKDYPTTIGYFEQAHASLLQHPDKYEKELTLVLEGLTEAYVRLDQPDKAAHYRTLLARR